MKRGVHAFFDAGEELDRQAMRRQVELCLEADVAGIAALGLATEVAKLSLLSDEASFVTGANWRADGGSSARFAG
jgi:dihydrodipicolinate synthase/N-acetylneuraminate lyase